MSEYAVVPVIVRWRDASSAAGWGAVGEGLGLMVPVTLGFLVHDDEESITVALTLCEDECASQMCIPKSWIEAMHIFDPDELLDLIL